MGTAVARGRRGEKHAMRREDLRISSVLVAMLDYRLPDRNDLTLLAAIQRLSPRSGVIVMGRSAPVTAVIDLQRCRGPCPPT